MKYIARVLLTVLAVCAIALSLIVHVHVRGNIWPWTDHDPLLMMFGLEALTLMTYVCTGCLLIYLIYQLIKKAEL